MAVAGMAVVVAVAAVSMVAAVASTAAEAAAFTVEVAVTLASVVARVLRGVRVEWHRDRFQGPVVAQ